MRFSLRHFLFAIALSPIAVGIVLGAHFLFDSVLNFIMQSGFDVLGIGNHAYWVRTTAEILGSDQLAPYVIASLSNAEWIPLIFVSIFYGLFSNSYRTVIIWELAASLTISTALRFYFLVGTPFFSLPTYTIQLVAGATCIISFYFALHFSSVGDIKSPGRFGNNGSLFLRVATIVLAFLLASIGWYAVLFLRSFGPKSV